MTLLLWAASASAVTLTLHFSDGNVDSVQVDESSQIYFYDPDMQVTRLTAPVNGAANVPQLTEFSWQHVADRDVELLISESEDFADTLYLITDIDTNTYTMSTPLEVQKRYYWKVRIEGETLWTAPWYFDTYMPALPEKVTSWMIQTATNGTHIVRNYASKIDSLMILFLKMGLILTTRFIAILRKRTLAIYLNWPDTMLRLPESMGPVSGHYRRCCL